MGYFNLIWFLILYFFVVALGIFVIVPFIVAWYKRQLVRR